MAKKKLYAVLWIDDYGALKLRKKDVDWYHKNAGPISYALECDERYSWSYDLVLNAKNNFSYDYLGYHYHPIRYTGLKLPKVLYDRLRLYVIVHSIFRSLNLKMTKKAFRTMTLTGFVVALLTVAITFFINIWIFAILSAIYAIIALLAGIWYYVQRPGNWEYPMSDKNFIKNHIINEKKEYEKRGFAFPTIVRHGWNLPWEGSMDFYIGLGFVADASAVTEGVDSAPHIEKRSIKWSVPQPYYADAGNDYNVPWNGSGACKKGILELPVFLGNVSAYGFGEREKDLIAKIPDGGLVGVYIHPPDHFGPIKEWATYLKENYDVEFITAWRAYELFK